LKPKNQTEINKKTKPKKPSQAETKPIGNYKKKPKNNIVFGFKYKIIESKPVGWILIFVLK